MSSYANPFRSRGFSLVELTVALVIVSILLTMGVSALTVQLENATHSSTQKKLQIIKDALTIYLGKYRRLPCPDLPAAAGNVAGQGDDNRATPGSVTTTCSATVGTVPYIDLGLSRDAVMDGWENFFTYAVTSDALDTADWTRSTAFAVGKPGKLIVQSRDPGNSAITTNLVAPENAVIVLISHGLNGLGAWTVQGTQNVQPVAGTDEAENADLGANTTFIVREPTTANIATYGAFDDKVSFIKAAELVATLVKDGSVRSAEGETRKLLSDTTEAVIGASISSAALPVTYAMPSDGWGTPMVYARTVATQILTNTAAGVAFTITSLGGNKVADGLPPGGDDIISIVSVDSLKTIYARAGTLSVPVVPPP